VHHGLLKGKIKVADDFNAPLDDETLSALGAFLAFTGTLSADYCWRKQEESGNLSYVNYRG
jgi:hypothetical protein